MHHFAVSRRGLMLALLAFGACGPVRAAQPAAAPATAGAQTPVFVFAAASLTNAFQDIGKAYAARGNAPVKFSFAASSTLAKQLVAGAPASIFASADLAWMDFTDSKGLTLKDSRVTALRNTLVLVAPAASAKPVTITRGMDMAALLGPSGRIATGLVDSVPVGVYAKAALVNLGLWDDVQPRIVGADSVRAALALVERGEAPFGIVYATDAAIAPNVRIVGTFPAGSHPPVDYPFALVKGQDTAQAKAFFAFLLSPQAKDIYRTYGFSVK